MMAATSEAILAVGVEDADRVHGGGKRGQFTSTATSRPARGTNAYRSPTILSNGHPPGRRYDQADILEGAPVKRAVVLIALFGVMTAACSSEPAELAGYVRTPAPNSAAISLPDATAGGGEFFLRAPEGGLLLIYFGFTACPDVCPTTMADIRTTLREMGDQADLIELAMVTVDPGRDGDEALAHYVQSFIPTGHALRTEDDAVLSEAALVLGAAYEVNEDEEGVVDVLHTAHTYVIDDRGDLLVTWPFGIETADMASDLRILLGR